MIWTKRCFAVWCIINFHKQFPWTIIVYSWDKQCSTCPFLSIRHVRLKASSHDILLQPGSPGPFWGQVWCELLFHSWDVPADVSRCRCAGTVPMCKAREDEYGYGSIPIHTIFRGMNIHLPAILRFTRGTRVLTHCHIRNSFEHMNDEQKHWGCTWIWTGDEGEITDDYCSIIIEIYKKWGFPKLGVPQ